MTKQNPTTAKDGKTSIVFTQQAGHNHEFDIRSAFEGRRLWEALQYLKGNYDNPEFVQSSSDVIMEYNANEDPFNIFANISHPLIGFVSQDRRTGEAGEDKYEGDKIEEPFNPIHIFPFRTSVPFEPIYNFGDSPNVLFVYDKQTERHLLPFVPELGKINVPGVREVHNKLQYKNRTIEALEDDTVMNGLEELSAFHVLYSLANAKRFLAGHKYPGNDWFMDVMYRDHTKTQASDTLVKRIADSTVKLCEEYRSEMDR
jgi:DNA-dependent RNA polymerase auxiliary subunit epsilon